MNDAELLRRYAQVGSEEAFAELVGLRIGLVYSAALRQAGGDVHRAQDITQAVFTDLAAKAASLCRHEALIGWLFTSARFEAGKMARAERRRRNREQEAFSMPEDFAPTTPETPAERIRPLLDDAMHQLSETDRHALLLRFFDGRSMNELGRSLGLSETAAQKRVERALVKLKVVFAKRGLSSTAAAIGAALGQEAVAATVPSGLAAAVSGGALAAASTAVAGFGIFSFLTGPMSLAAGLSGITLAVAIGVVAYENRAAEAKPGGADSGRATEVDSSVAVRVIGASELKAKETEPIETDARPMADLTPIVRKPATAAAAPSLSAQTLQSSLPDNTVIDKNLIVLPSGAGNLASGLRVFDPGQLDHRPVPTSPLRPNYPLEMWRKKISGEVLIDFIVDADGRVRNAVAASSSRGEFEPAAIEAVSVWKFKPGRKGGRAVPTHMRVPIVFTLDSHE